MVWGSEAEEFRDQLAASILAGAAGPTSSDIPCAWEEPVKGKEPLAGMVKPLALTPAG